MKYFVILTIIGISLLYSHLPDAESRTVSPLSITLEDNTVKQNSFITGDGRIVITIQKEQTVSFPLKVTQSRHDSLPVYFPHSVEYAIPDTRKSILPDMKIEFEPFNMILKPNVPQILNVTITTMNYTQLGEHRVTLTAQYPQGEPLLNTGFDVLVVNETQYENLNSNSKYPVPGGGIISDIYPVKKQFEMGIKLENLKCNEGHVLIQKYDGSPACVTESTKQKLIERGWTEQSLPPCTSDRSACFNQESNICDPSGWECDDNGEIFSETVSLLPEPKKPPTAFPYIWNDYLHKQGIEFEPKEQSYINTDEGWYSGLNRVCSPIITSNGTELYVSSTFVDKPFEIIGTFIDNTKPDDCHKIWKTESVLPEPDKELEAWLEIYHNNK